MAVNPVNINVLILLFTCRANTFKQLPWNSKKAMNKYEYHVLLELDNWKLKMIKKPSLTNQLTRSIQHRVNDMIPEKIHNFLTSSIKQMVRGVISGAKFTTSSKSPYTDLETPGKQSKRKDQILPIRGCY